MIPGPAHQKQYTIVYTCFEVQDDTLHLKHGSSGKNPPGFFWGEGGFLHR